MATRPDWSERDLRTLDRLLPAIRSWVEQSNPHDAKQAAWYMSSRSGDSKVGLRFVGHL